MSSLMRITIFNYIIITSTPFRRSFVSVCQCKDREALLIPFNYRENETS